MSAAAGLLAGVRVVSLAPNLPGPAAAARLVELGAAVTKVEGPGGDLMAHFRPEWYAELCRGQTVLRLDLKQAAERERLQALLADADLLLSSSRPSALARLGLDWETLHARHPRLCQVAIVGEAPPDAERPGHDLTYQAATGLVEAERMPRTLLADLAGAERAVSAALALLLARERDGEGRLEYVALADAARAMATPLRHAATTAGGPLGGGLPQYGLYPARNGTVAVGCLEPHFSARLAAELDLVELTAEALRAAFAARDADAWEAWARERDLPLVAVRADHQF